jgi:hypothetical protein
MTPHSAPATVPTEISVVNVGLPLFADAVETQGRPADQLDWRIPANGEPQLIAALTTLLGDHAARIDAANTEVFRRLDTATASWTAVATTGEVLPGLGRRTLLHCGPALEWPDVCDPLRRSMRAATVAEGWAADVAEADSLLRTGKIRLEPANLHATVVPMATALGPSMPVLVVDNHLGGTQAYSAINQGAGDVAWFGRQTDAAIERLRFLRDVAGPLLGAAVAQAGPVDVLSLASQGLAMGDDVHMRTQASTNLLIRHLLPQLVAASGPAAVEFARYLSANHLFFLNLAMAAAKSLTMWAEQVEDSSIVTTMTRNGTTFGVRVAGSSAWFLADAPEIGDALYNPGFGPGSGARDIGDSAVLELIGLGGAAAAGSPAVAAFLGGALADAIEVTEEMTDICHGTSSRFKLPTLGMRGTPVGVDTRLVAKLGTSPKVNTGILHVSDGTGQVGAGVATAPVDCFTAAVMDLAARLT